MPEHSIDIRTFQYLLAVEIKETNWQFDNAGLPTILPLIFVFSVEPNYDYSLKKEGWIHN